MKRPLFNGLALLAVVYLVVMVTSGEQMRQAQFVAFEAKGLLAQDPSTVHALQLQSGGRSVELKRAGNGWQQDGKPVAEVLAPRVALAVKFLHTAEPVRVIEAAAMAGTKDDEYGFGADSLRVTASLVGGGSLALTFGRQTPEGSVQYLRLDGDDRVYLMSRFVGEEWEAVWAGLQ